MEELLQERIAKLRAKLDDKYMPIEIAEEIRKDIEFLLKLQHALYFY